MRQKQSRRGLVAEDVLQRIVSEGEEILGRDDIDALRVAVRVAVEFRGFLQGQARQPNFADEATVYACGTIMSGMESSQHVALLFEIVKKRKAIHRCWPSYSSFHGYRRKYLTIFRRLMVSRCDFAERLLCLVELARLQLFFLAAAWGKA
jgi:hypothetical protein